MGLITSLPELVGTLTAAVFRNNADLGVGNIFGSNIFNIAILSLAVLMYSRRIPMAAWRWRSNFSAYLTVALAAFMAMIIAIYAAGAMMVADLANVMILAFYLGGMWIYARQGEDDDLEDEEGGAVVHSLPQNLVLVAVFGALVVAAGLILAGACDDIAGATALSSTFVGSLLMAAATSLPELVVTMRLLKKGNIGMATGNIFGSNAMNLSIIAVVDLCYRGTMYATVTAQQTVTLAAGILMAGIFLAGAQVRSLKRKALNLDNLLILTLYFWTYYWLYTH